MKPRGSKNPNGSVAPNCSDGWNGGGVAASAACAECTNISLKVRTWDVQNVQMDFVLIQILDSRMLSKGMQSTFRTGFGSENDGIFNRFLSTFPQIMEDARF